MDDQKHSSLAFFIVTKKTFTESQEWFSQRKLMALKKFLDKKFKVFKSNY